MRRRLPVILAICSVLVVYWFFASYGHFAFHSHGWDAQGSRPGDGLYASLAEGFLRGQLSMAHEPDARLKAMPDPNDYVARERDQIPYIWDASYFEGQYYLYFSPLPVLVFYIPFRLIFAAYPDDQLVALVFAAWAFIMAALLVQRALGDKARVPVALWIVLLGLGGVVPYVLVFSRVYEVATFCGTALSITWAWSFLRYFERPRRSQLVWMSLWLALAIATRPHLGILLPVAFFALPKPRQREALIALIPLSLIGAAVLLYNYARFHHPLEFGLRYQLTHMSMENIETCACRNLPEFFRLVNNLWLYLFAPPFVGGGFPYLDLSQHRLDPAVSFGVASHGIGGLLPLLPLVAIGSAVALFVARRRHPLETGTRAAIVAVVAGCAVLVALSSCWWVTARYALDFLLLLAAGSVVVLDQTLDTPGLRRLAVVLACYSIAIGIMLGFRGPQEWFSKQNPELFQTLKHLTE